MNSRWSSDRVFETARSIVIAQLQHVTYSEFLPLVIGQDSIK